MFLMIRSPRANNPKGFVTATFTSSCHTHTIQFSLRIDFCDSNVVIVWILYDRPPIYYFLIV